MLLIVSVIFGLLVFLVLSNVIVDVRVVHESRFLRELIIEALKDEGVEPLTFKKSYKEYERIIAKIKSNYKDKIEWLEIDVKGMVIDIRVEERIINNYDKEEGTCHIVASKSGIVKCINVNRGVQNVMINDFVVKDEVLISGEVKLNEAVVNNVCARGEVRAEVWYKVNVSLPLKYQEEVDTGKVRFNLMVKNGVQEYVILKSRVGEKRVKNILLFKIFGWEVYVQKEIEVKVEDKEYSNEEAIRKAAELAFLKMKQGSGEELQKIDEKVLKKSINNGNLDIELFVAVNEQIGIKKYYEVETDSDTNGKEYNRDNNRVD